MYHAITIKDGRITGRHQSIAEITTDTFAQSPAFAGHQVQAVDAATEYAEGQLMAAYDPAGILRPLIDRINEGLAQVPDGYELIDGQLVETALPEQEAPPTLMARVQAAEAKAADAEHKALTAHALEVKASRAVYTALLANNTITDAVASTLPELAPQMAYTGKSIPANTRIQWDYNDGNGPVVVKAKVTLWDREDNDPDHAPGLWDVLQYRDGHRIIPEVITAELAFGKDEIGYWPADSKFYRAKRAGVVHTPAAYPADWEEVNP